MGIRNKKEIAKTLVKIENQKSHIRKKYSLFMNCFFFTVLSIVILREFYLLTGNCYPKEIEMIMTSAFGTEIAYTMLVNCIVFLVIDYHMNLETKRKVQLLNTIIDDNSIIEDFEKNQITLMLMDDLKENFMIDRKYQNFSWK